MMQIFLSGPLLANVLLGVLVFFIFIFLLSLFLNWLSGAANVKIVSKHGNYTVIDNTAKNRTLYVEVDKSIAQINLENQLLEEREKLRISQEEKIVTLREKNQNKLNKKKEKAQNDYDLKKIKYEEDMKAFNKKKENGNFVIEPWKPVIPVYYEPINDIISIDHNNHNVLEIQYKSDRRALREIHAKQIIFKDEFEKSKFISTDYEIQIPKKQTIIIPPR